MELNLLMPATHVSAGAGLPIELNGQQLQMVTLPEGTWETQPYTCVSFAWGDTRMPNPLAPDFSISARSVQVLQTATQALRQLTEGDSGFALWMDVFCIPNDAQLKSLYLSRMGDIYAQAEQVIVVLSSNMQPLLKAIRTEAAITDDLLMLLNHDEWVTRAWTYQEIVNSGQLFLVAEGENEAPIKGHVFFDAIAKAIEPFGKAAGYDAFTQQEKLPGLTAFEAVVLDWRIADYTERSAYQVMANMCFRKTDQPDGMIYAMVGCMMGYQPTIDRAALTAAELFMQVCEAKGDYSFIYATDARSNERDKPWRPAAGSLRPVMPYLYCFGEGQPGKLTPDGLELQQVCLFAPHTVGPDILNNTLNVMRYHRQEPINNPLDFILTCMRKVGFTGCGQIIELEKGYFFPQEQIEDLTDIQVVVATEICWTFGAPGLLVKSIGSGKFQYIGVGVFAGQSGKGEDTVVIV